jgi:predicted nucleotidyltransferase
VRQAVSENRDWVARGARSSVFGRSLRSLFGKTEERTAKSEPAGMDVQGTRLTRLTALSIIDASIVGWQRMQPCGVPVEGHWPGGLPGTCQVTFMYELRQKKDQVDERLRDLLLRCAESVQRDYPDARIILYGSRARGEARADSDLDMLVLLSSDISSQERCRIHDQLYEIGLDQDVVISAIIKSVWHWERPMSRATPLYEAIQNEGILVA